MKVILVAHIRASGVEVHCRDVLGKVSLFGLLKRHLRKFNGVPKEHFHLFLKVREWRFNNSDPKFLLKQLNQ